MEKNKILSAYNKALEIRIIETLIAENYKSGQMRCPTHLSIGQELVPSILSLFHDPEDKAFSSHRSHGHYLGKNGNLEIFLDELHGLPSGCSGGKGGSMHLVDESVGFMGSTAIVGNTIPIGVGFSESQKLLKSKNFTYIFLGDAATEEGVFYESLNFACVRKLPCFFIVENNEYSVYTPMAPRQCHDSIKKRCLGFECLYLFNDENDFEDLFSKWNIAISFIKKESRPVVLEVKTHRYREHCGPNYDDDLGYRPDELLSKWNDCDILHKYEQYLQSYCNKDKNYLLKNREKINDKLTNIFQSSQKRYEEFSKNHQE